MFTIHHVLVFISYLCARNAQCWARITKSDMGIQRYNRLKAAIKREQNEVHFNSAEREQARTQFKIVLAEKEWTGTWLSEQVGHNICTVSRWMTNKIQPSVELLGSAAFIAKRRKNSSISPSISMWM